MATATLDRSAPGKPLAGDSDLVDLGYRCVWKAHVDREGTRYGKSELEQIVRRCNKRIDETGDYAPLAVAFHTNENPDPEVVGFAGPYKMGEIGDGVPAVYAKLRVFKGDIDKVRKHPRISVEYWCSNDNPYGGYFDPITLLGAKTPELDLGVMYSREPRPGEKVAMYSRAIHYGAVPTSPGGSNATLGEDLSGKPKKKKKSAAGASGESDSQDAHDENYAKDDANSSGDSTTKPQESGDPGDPAIARDTSTQDYGGDWNSGRLGKNEIQQIVEALRPVIEAIVDERMPPPSAEMEMDSTPEPVPGMPPGMPGQPPQAGQQLPGQPPQPGVPPTDGPPQGKDGKPANPNSPPEKSAMSDEPNAADTKDKEKLATYAKERDDLQKLYAKEKAEKESLQAKLDDLSKKERKATRYAKLADLANEGYSFDANEEVADVLDLTDEAFEKHCGKIQKHYARIPLGTLPVESEDKKLPLPVAGDADKALEKRTMYAKQAQEKCLEAAAEGKRLVYEKVLAEVVAAGEKRPAGVIG